MGSRVWAMVFDSRSVTVSACVSWASVCAMLVGIFSVTDTACVGALSVEAMVLVSDTLACLIAVPIMPQSVKLLPQVMLTLDCADVYAFAYTVRSDHCTG